MKRSVSLSITIAALLILCGQANGKETWTRVQSKNFTLVGDANERDIRKIAIKLETFRQTLAIMFPKAKITAPIPTTVVIFKSNDAFRPFKPRYKGKIRETVGGYFLPGPHINYIVLAADKEVIDPYEVIFHEYEHFMLRNNLLHIPLWLDEGLAEFYSSFQTTDNDQGIKLGIPLPQHIFYLRNHSILALKTFLAVDRKSPHYNESSKVGVFYAQSWALVHYLMNGNQRKREPQLIKFIDLVNAGTPLDESFNKAFEADYGTIEKELRAYINRFTFPVLNGTFQHQLDLDKEMQSVALSDAETQYYQGDLLLRMRQIPEAKVFLEKSIALDGGNARSLISLGIVRMLEQHQEEAAKLFQTAVETDPADYLAHYCYAQSQAGHQQYEEAIKSYKKAIALKPDLGTLFVDLGYAYQEAGNEEEAIRTWEEGKRVNPRERYFYRSLGYIHLKRGSGDLAASAAYSYLRTAGWRDEHSPYMLIVWYLALRQGKRDAFAVQTLQESIGKIDPADWPYPVLQYLNHTLTLTEMLAQANDKDKLTEAHTYAGLALSFSGETQAALEQLRWVKEKGNSSFVEYPLALGEIARLESATVRSK